MAGEPTTDRLTFEQVYDENAARVLNLALRLTGDEETARDLTQEIFVKVYTSLDTFEHRSAVSTWVYRIAVNHITNHLKKERRRRLLSLRETDASQASEVEAGFWGRRSTVSSDKGLERAERDRIVWRAIQTLPEKYRIPLVLFHYENLSYKEIAEAMQIGMSALESRLHRAKKELIRKLEPWLDKI